MMLVMWLALIGAIYSRTDDYEYMKIIHVNCGFSEMNMKAIFIVMNTTWAVVKVTPKKKFRIVRIWTYDLCHTGGVLHQLS